LDYDEDGLAEIMRTWPYAALKVTTKNQTTIPTNSHLWAGYYARYQDF